MEDTTIGSSEPWLEKWVAQFLFHDVRTWMSENYALIWCVFFGLIVLYLVYDRVLRGAYYNWARRREETRDLTDEERVRLMDTEESRRVARLKQQQQTRELAAIAEEKRKEREREKRLQKLSILETKYNGDGRPLGTEEDDSPPAPPSSSSTSRNLGSGKSSRSASSSSSSCSSRNDWSPLWGSSGGGGGYRPSGFKRPSGGG